MRDDIMLGARWNSAMWSGVGKELFTGDRGRVGGFEVTMIVTEETMKHAIGVTIGQDMGIQPALSFPVEGFLSL